MRCPFCKTANYAVEYCGVKSKEEKGLEQIVSCSLSLLLSFGLSLLKYVHNKLCFTFLSKREKKKKKNYVSHKNS